MMVAEDARGGRARSVITFLTSRSILGRNLQRRHDDDAFARIEAVHLGEELVNHSYRSASIGLRRAALRAGYQPKNTPIATAHVKARRTAPEVTVADHCIV